MGDAESMALFPAEQPSQREEFLTGMLAYWIATGERGEDAKPRADEKARARAGARAALREIA